MTTTAAAGTTSATAGTTSAAAGTTTAAAGTTAVAQATTLNVPFMLDVQRQESGAQSQETGSSISSPATIGTLIVAGLPQVSSSQTWTSSTPAAEPADNAALTADVSTTAVAATAPPTSDPIPDALDGFNVRVSTGPLASRSASPLGPTLASVDGEATQAVDRHERAMSQEIDGLGSDDGEQSTAWQSNTADRRTATEQRSSEFAEPGEVVVAVQGRGGFPLKVTSRGRGRHGRFTELWATLPSETDSPGAVSSSAESNALPSDLSLSSAAADRATDPVEVPDYVKAAWGLAIGLGLTSGPLFSDLIASFPSRVPKWLVILQPGSGRARSSAPARKRLRRLAPWLRGRLLRKRVDAASVIES